MAATLAKEAVAGLEVVPSAEVCCWSLSLDTLLADDPLDFSSTCIGEADRYQTTAHQEHRLGVSQETQASCVITAQPKQRSGEMQDTGCHHR